MARKNQFGKFILSAGEIGSYTVCPEAWRLRALKGVRTDEEAESKTLGKELHTEWSSKLNDWVTLHRGARLLLLTVFMLVVVYSLPYLFNIGAR